MGYSTDFEGRLKFNRVLTDAEASYLKRFAESRRMVRNVDSKYGVQGEFYIDGGDYNDTTVVEMNVPPSTQPGLWCQWTPSEDGMYLEWDGGEKFYNYVEWLQYIINSIFPYITEDNDEALVLNGVIDWQGEESEDVGRIMVNNNVVSTLEGHITFDETDVTRVFFVTDGPIVEDDQDNQNEELHETLEGAQKYAKTMLEPRIRICLVRHAYREENGSWNYDDLSDTFETIKEL